MHLYHFTAKRFIDLIKDQGLTRGVLPIVDKQGKLIELQTPCQWLTTNPDFNQPWDNPDIQSLDYDRNDYRIEVAIPIKRGLFQKWTEICDSTEELRITSKTLNSFGDPWNWYCYFGPIKTGWFREIKSNPNKKFILSL